MKKDGFKPHCRYTVTLRDEAGKWRPANIYVYKLYDDFMIARMLDQGSLLCKIHYENIVKIVKAIEITKNEQFYVPDALLAEKVWKDRAMMYHYGSSPRLGK